MNKLLLLLIFAAIIAAVYYQQANASGPANATQSCVEGDMRGVFCANSSALSFTKCLAGEWVEQTVACGEGNLCNPQAAGSNGGFTAGCVAVPQATASATPVPSANPLGVPAISGNYSSQQPSCGDGFCALAGDYRENCSSCASDCGCAAGDYCNAGIGACEPKCGNNRCDAGETSGSCCVDCACSGGLKCDNSSMLCFQPVNLTQSQLLTLVSSALAESHDSLSNYTYSVSDYHDASGEAFKRVTLNCVQASEYACGMIIDADSEGELHYRYYN
ncbi:hypothetical protein COX86_04460 [Candidatus Micrarchaeota archaeon CG_4_10_14_0_2_um_filter_60_11]|nr:MAG: hypothetical protein AUJ16_02475 [Candidatus Micrarchaeota archaeon CG1_02_60_51]PIN96461.1 MAG: hypothetical protein COU39_01085 [Candidatus Micrarchaeota archaeon CG10_big_fil_rev_8_21_14_0_10_60_32]PIO02448.1 MAG: hypothetical protein COT58_00095 [Candidatus Micrarchaeota archaeon CG09_land_8_20_14_0_10_60_16]PIZ90537.1 MAG: hypothetical protein COX86_04460 [Candidatus Micrarchaeota archaeon CG_4_10_14_0_2_um_filter_60_11]